MADDKYKDIPPGLFDWFVSTDERVNAVHKELLNVAEGVEAVKDIVAALPGAEEVPVLATKGRSIPLYAKVESLDIAEVTDDAPIAGKIKEVIISWPDGCDFNVLVAFGHSDQWIVPGFTDHYERNNDTSVTYPLNEPVYEGEELWLRICNGDDTNPHEISATVVIVK